MEVSYGTPDEAAPSPPPASLALPSGGAGGAPASAAAFSLAAPFPRLMKRKVYADWRGVPLVSADTMVMLWARGMLCGRAVVRGPRRLE